MQVLGHLYASRVKALGVLEDYRCPELLIEKSGHIAIYYVPFERLNERAKLVLVGITPGFFQMTAALKAYAEALHKGCTHAEAQDAAYSAAAFGGPMRANLIRMLDAVGIARWLGIQSSETLFSEHAQFVHMTSMLRYPVFRGDRNYNGYPRNRRHPILYEHLMTYFGGEAKLLRGAQFLPLGPRPEAGLRLVASEGYISSEQILPAIPHPSGANNGRVAQFLSHQHVWQQFVSNG